ncbi:MAG: hypothetical protein MAG453_01381 [Calditrichaeota bacterium]|nr:hypothetical protein [Calditrichota bacterium]
MGMNERRHGEHTTPVYDPHRGRRIRATAYLVALTMIWGLTFPVMKLAVADTDAIHFLTLRFLPAVAILFAWRMRRGGIQVRAGEIADENASLVEAGLHPFWVRLRNGPLRSTWLRGIVIGLFLFAGFALQVTGLEHTTASRSAFFTGLLVVLVPVLALVLRTSRTPTAAWFALAPAAAGVTLIADPKTGGLNLGDWLTFGCALSFALQMVMLEALTRSDHETDDLTFAQIITVTVLAGAWSVIEGKPLAVEPVGWIAVAYTALFGTVIAIWLQTRHQPYVPSGHAALVFTLEPVFAGLFAWVLIGDPWTLRGLIGAALVLAAMSVSSLALARKETAAVRERDV